MLNYLHHTAMPNLPFSRRHFLRTATQRCRARVCRAAGRASARRVSLAPHHAGGALSARWFGGHRWPASIREPLSRILGVPVVVDNRPGAGGSVATQSVARSKPDGYTLVVSSQSSHLANPLTQPKLGYDPIKDFENIAILGRQPNAAGGALPSLPVRTFAEFLAYAKKNPGKLDSRQRRGWQHGPAECGDAQGQHRHLCHAHSLSGRHAFDHGSAEQ
ncbi:Bug family tripartite tricarboxylate transporter substrate binding protein [Bradyrhizobium betae]